MAADEDQDERVAFEDGGSAEATIAGLSERVARLELQVAQLTGAQEAGLPVARALPRVNVGVARPLSGAAGALPLPMPPLSTPGSGARASLEDRLGAQIFNLIGVVALIVGASWALKLAFERGWVGPIGRVIVGLAAGAGLILWSERFRRKGFAAFSYSLKAVGSGVLYLALWAGFQLYHVLPAGVALAAMILVTAWNGFMAWSQDAELLAGYGLIGGFATPLLLSTGGNHETFLFTYVAAIDLATVLPMRWKRWPRLLLPAFAGTAAYFIGWYSEFFGAGALADGGNAQAALTASFAVVFFVLFALVSVKGWSAQGDGAEAHAGEVIVPVLVPLANAAFIGLALYSVLEDSGGHAWLAWAAVGLAAVYLGLMRVQASAVAGAMHLAAAVVFSTIAIPLKASGHWLTTAWLVEGLVLYWASTRVDREGVGGEGAAPRDVLRVLSAAGYVLGLGSLLAHYFIASFWSRPGFLDANLGAALVAVAALAGGAWIAAEARSDDGTAAVNVWAFLAGIDFVAVLVASRELAGESARTAFAKAQFASAAVGLAILGATAWAAHRLSDAAERDRGATLAGISLVLFNLVALASVVNEIAALWPGAEDRVQRSLAISAFPMAYGAGLLAAGFWRRNAFVRWQGLILLIFTIAKVFLYDVSGLSQGYRVASFLGLGALLMAVSFAYQKDWLGLRPDATEDAATEPVKDSEA